MNIFITTITIAPGIPKSPIKIEVIKFKPIWNPKAFPIKLMMKMSTPPNIELMTNFSIVLIGTIKTFPNINKKIIQAM